MNKRILNLLLMGLMLGLVWLALSGLFKPLLVGLGMAATLLTLWLSSRMGIIDAEKHAVWSVFRFVAYWPWLSIEIVKSSIDVARRVLSPSMPISPTVFEVRATQKTLVGRVVLANSITLTPGTVTLDVDGDRLTVHALASESVEYAMNGEMDRRVSRAEGATSATGSGRADSGDGA